MTMTRRSRMSGFRAISVLVDAQAAGRFDVRWGVNADYRQADVTSKFRVAPDVAAALHLENRTTKPKHKELHVF
jgi:hypothetical protein